MKLQLCATILLTWMTPDLLRSEEFARHTFERQRLTETYFSEGANAGDINGDGQPDVVYGPYWFAGPKFETKHEIYPPQPQNTEKYADNFFNWVYDFNGDGASDVFVVGFPGTPAYVYENPKSAGLDRHWKRHTVFEAVSNESPHFVNLVGDKRPELVCTLGGAFGFATIDWERPFEPWNFHRVSDQAAPARFGHGLGIGDVSGDGLSDILIANGWFEQPAKSPLESRWEFHPASFTNAYGGAEMYAYDVDGDGDNDVITSLAAHDFGLAWYEQVREGAQRVFRQHLIMGSKPAQNRYGLVFSEPHSVALADIDGDGLQDIVTGKTYYSHHKQSPLWDAGAVVYWFRLTRAKDGVDWIPYRADGEAGIGRQISIADINGDKLPDIVVGGMKGAHVLTHRKQLVSEEEFRQSQPKPSDEYGKQAQRVAPNFDAQTGQVAGAIEAEDLKILSTSAGKTRAQEMQNFKKDRWSGGKQLFWSGAKPDDRLELEFNAAKSGEYDILATFTMAPDYATVRCELDGKPLDAPADLFNYPDVITSGEVNLGRRKLAAGTHALTLIIAGANPAATRAYMVGLDYLRLHPITTDAQPTEVDQMSQYPPDPPMPGYQLPAALQTSAGTAVTTGEQWTKTRRGELLELFRTHVYGRVPKTSYDQSFHVVREDAQALGGAATLQEVEIRIKRGEKSLAIRANVFIPNQPAQPVPAFLLICNRGAENIDPTREKKSEFWPVEEGIARGYAMVAFLNADVDPDKHDGFQNGIHGILDEGERAADAWGTIAAWAWGASRVLDYLQTVPRIDAQRVAVIGHSRGGKTALWAAAEDQRFALAISNDSGCGGAALSRRRFQGREQVARIVSAFPHWFCTNFKSYADREDELPIDQHELIALIAPRAVAVGSASEDRWADPRGEFLSIVHAAPVYELFGHQALGTKDMPRIDSAVHGDRAHYHLRAGKHNLTLVDWQHYWDYADRVYERKAK